MSRAFVKEDVPESEAPARLVAPLPEGAVNYVTPHGKRLLHEAVLEAEGAVLREEDPARRANLRHSLEELRYRWRSATVIDLSSDPPQDIRFGATVSLRGEDGRETRVTLVGVDEADAASDRLSIYSALAQALLRKRAGDTVVLESDERKIRWEVVSVSYGG